MIDDYFFYNINTLAKVIESFINSNILQSVEHIEEHCVIHNFPG